MTQAEDEIQSLILRWYHRADVRAGGRAFVLLKQEWLLPVARFVHRDVMSPDTEDALSSVLLAALSHSPEKKPNVLAPAEHPSPRAWRTIVLRNALISVWRHQRVRRAAETALREEYLQHPAREAAGVTAGRGEQPLGNSDGSYEAEQRVLLQQMRSIVLRALPLLPVRRRCALALLLDVDVSAWIEELAADLGEDGDALRGRLEAADSSAAQARSPGTGPAARGPAAGEELSDAQVRILYPTEELGRAREALRKSIERGVKDVQAHVAKGVA